MKNSHNVQAHPNLEDKSGNPTFASASRVNYSTNESRSLEPGRPLDPTPPKNTLRSLLRRIFRARS